MPYRRAERPAGSPSADDTTVAEVEESLGRMVAAARTARERGNDLLVAAQHRRIDERLEVWQVLWHLENVSKSARIAGETSAPTQL